MNTVQRILVQGAVAAAGALTCAAVSAQAPAHAADSSATTTGETQPGSKAAREASHQFIADAASSNRAEIQEGRYVLDHSGSEAVKGFARKMIHDHTMALDQLKAVAGSEGLQVPGGISSKEQESLRQLKHDQGSKLDSAYASEQARDHQETIAKFEQAQNSTALLSAVRDYARKTLPTLREHLKLARQLAASDSKSNRKTG